MMFIKDSVLQEQLEKIHRHYQEEQQKLLSLLEEASITNKELLKEYAKINKQLKEVQGGKDFR